MAELLSGLNYVFLLDLDFLYGLVLLDQLDSVCRLVGFQQVCYLLIYSSRHSRAFGRKKTNRKRKGKAYAVIVHTKTLMCRGGSETTMGQGMVWNGR